MVASVGYPQRVCITTGEAGSIFRLNPISKVLTLDKSAEQIGNLDGVSISGVNLITNDWINGNVFEVGSTGTKLLFNAGKGAADISVANGQLYVPMMLDNRLDVYSLGQHQKSY